MHALLNSTRALYITLSLSPCTYIQYKEKAWQEKDALKRAARQHKHRAVHSRHTVGQLTQQLEEAVSINTHTLPTLSCGHDRGWIIISPQNCALEETRSELAQLEVEKMKQQTELSSLST